MQTPKSDASERVIPLTSDLLCYLKTAVRGLPEHAYILTGRTDKPMEPRTLRYYFSGFLKQCGIRYRNFHVLRHTFATRCIETGMDVKSLSELLGHADVRTTLKLYCMAPSVFICSVVRTKQTNTEDFCTVERFVAAGPENRRCCNSGYIGVSWYLRDHCSRSVFTPPDFAGYGCFSTVDRTAVKSKCPLK